MAWKEGVKPFGGFRLFRSCFKTQPPHGSPPPLPHPPTLLSNLQCTQGISPGSACTFHNRLIQLNITPAESWVTLSADPHLPPHLPVFLPLSSTFSYNQLLTLSLIDSCHSSFCDLPQLAASSLQRSPCSRRRAAMFEARRGVQHMCSVFAWGAIWLNIPQSGACTSHLSTERFDKLHCRFFFVTRSPKQGTGFPIHFHEFPEQLLKSI